MEKFGVENSPQFSSPEEELHYLREKVAEKEREAENSGENLDRSELISGQIRDHHKNISHHSTKDYGLEHSEIEKLALDLSPEEHDNKMSELLSLLKEKGIKNTLAVIEKMGNSHLEDDFHRFIVQYVSKGYPVQGLKEKGPLHKAFSKTLYEIVLPTDRDDGGRERVLKEVISSMEQFYAGMLSISPDKKSSDNYLTLELANANGSDEFVFYTSVPNSKAELFEKHILSIFHNAKISVQKDDYNIFNKDGVAVGSYASAGRNPIFPIKTYEEFDYDPLNSILNSFSKIDKEGEGAAIQIIFNPVGEHYINKYKHALEQIKKGVPVKEAIHLPENISGEAFKTIKEAFFSSKKKNSEEQEPPQIDQSVIENIEKKISSPIVRTNIRLMVSAKTKPEAEEILSNIESSFNQFENTQGNRLGWKRVSGWSFKSFSRNFSFRMYSASENIPLNIKELTSLFHFHSSHVKSSPQLKKSKASDAPVPRAMPTEGALLGVNRYRNVETKVVMSPEDRLRHFYVIGQTGTGKTSLLKNMINQDIASGEGVCMIDPHGSDIEDVLANIPKERYEDVIYFDPSRTDRPMGLNMLEYDRDKPEQKTFVVNELFSIFQKLYGGVPESMGPMFEQYFRNATTLVIEDPDSGCTLLDVSRVLADKSFRDLKLSRCRNPIVVQFWRDIAEKAGGEGALQNIVPYITSKFDVFLANDVMRPIVAQEKSAFDFRKIMDERKILLVNLAKGRLGDINSNLLGLILVGKILMASLSRVDSVGKDLPPFYLYIDEFQNVTTNSIASILSEARKYKLGLNIAHQFTAQLTDEIKDAVFGNVGSMAVFRVGSEDAEYLKSQFEPVFSPADIMNIDNYNAYVKMLVNGVPAEPFNIETLPPSEGDGEVASKLKEYSALKYGRDRSEVDAEIMGKYRKQ